MDLEIRDDEITCAACGGNNVSRRMELDEFEYGAGEAAVSLSANVVVFACDDCDSEFTGPSAEVARHDAVCRHLGVMTPAEIRDLRGRYGLSRQSFASITRLGAASIARWEAGSLLQNRAYDSLLYLLCFEDNLRRLRSRHTTAAPDERVSTTSEAPGYIASFTAILVCWRDPGRACAAKYGQAAGRVDIRLHRGMAHPGRAGARRTGDAVPSVFP